MDFNKYGPFANIVMTAGFLVAAFGVLFFKMLGHSRSWSWLARNDVPAFFIAVPARIGAVILMAITYTTINTSNYGWFAGAALIFAALGMYFLNRFNLSRNLYIIAIPLVARDGSVSRDRRGNEVTRNIVIGLDSEIKPEIQKEIAKRYAADHTVTTRKFLAGAGPNEPEILWDRDKLAKIKTKLATSLAYVSLCAVMTLFLAAFIIVVFDKTAH